MAAVREKTQFELPRGFIGRILLMSMNLGLALEDMGVAIRVYHQALAKGAGHRLPL